MVKSIKNPLKSIEKDLNIPLDFKNLLSRPQNIRVGNKIIYFGPI